MNPEVRYAHLKPLEFEKRLQDAPIAYVPFGSLEWHSYHLPYGVDSLKAEAVLVQVATARGGIVVPPVYWGRMNGKWRGATHPGVTTRTRNALYREIFAGLVEVGFRAILAVSGHWSGKQLQSMKDGLAKTCHPGQTAGLATFDCPDPNGGLPADPEMGMDHAGKWETSIFMHLFPSTVALDRLRSVDLSDLPGIECRDTISGIQGEDPMIEARSVIGQRHVERLVDFLGKQADLLLDATGWRAST